MQVERQPFNYSEETASWGTSGLLARDIPPVLPLILLPDGASFRIVFSLEKRVSIPCNGRGRLSEINIYGPGFWRVNGSHLGDLSFKETHPFHQGFCTMAILCFPP